MNMCVCAERVFRHAYVVERQRSTKVFEGINIPFAHANTLVLFKGAYPRIRQKDVNDGRYWNEHDAQGKQKQLHGERLVLEPGYSRIPHAHQMLLTAGVGDKLHTGPKCQAQGAKALVLFILYTINKQLRCHRHYTWIECRVCKTKTFIRYFDLSFTVGRSRNFSF